MDAKHLKNFIAVLETLPELWDPHSPLYKDRGCRKLAINTLLPIYQKIQPDADEAAVRRKINTLQTNYRKELKKIISKKHNGKSYKPTSWVFHALKFLDKKVSVDYTSEDHQEALEVKVEPTHLSSQSSSSNSSISPITAQLIIPRKKIKSPIRLNQLPSLECDHPKQPDTPAYNDIYDCIAKVWANKLRGLEKNQMLLAERAINDILFQANMNILQMPTNLQSQENVPSTTRDHTRLTIFSHASSTNSQITSNCQILPRPTKIDKDKELND